MRYAGSNWLVRLLLAGALAPGGAALAAAEEPLSVVYGPKASAGEGDPDHREVLFLRVPAGAGGRLHLRVFDADVGGMHDLRYGAGWGTLARYALFGGAGAASLPASPLAPAGAEAEPAGTLLAEAEIGEDPAFDGSWRTLASFTPDQGEQVGGERVFRLEVSGVGGDDANAFMATLSQRDYRDQPPPGLRVESPAPTVRIADEQRLTELPLTVPQGAERLVVHNFDAAAGSVAFASTWRTVQLAASGQDEWRRSELELLPEERGAVASLVVADGEEMPNDVTLVVTDGAGTPLMLGLPARAWTPNNRPLPVARATALADCAAFAFDAAASSDEDGDRLRYFWSFGDGQSAEGMALVHRYREPGRYRAMLRVQDSSGQIGNGAARSLDVLVKRPPVAVAGPDMRVAPGQEVRFDGSASRPGERPIASWRWNFQDGAQAVGPQPVHRFEQPGRYVVTLEVSDGGPDSCTGSTDRLLVEVNAPPVAVPGPERRVAAGEKVRLDASRSYDIDGAISRFAWDLGDGASAGQAAVEHAYERPGTYVVALEVEDDAGLANSRATAATRILVNEPPVADAGPDRSAAVGELLRFDGGGSSDGDGRIVRHAWEFGDGATGGGERVAYAYAEPGTYEVRLTVVDDSGTSSGTTEDTAIVRVNAPPVADAGPDQVVTASEVRFDGSASHDPDGAIARWLWDFGDGTAGEGPSPVHVYREPGRYRVVLTVTDDSGTSRNSASDSLRVLVNEAPIADAGPDRLAAPGQELVFSAAGSFDPDGDILEHLWDFKDGGTASGERVAHTFQRPGVYQVRLAVRDDTGQPDAVDYDEARVVINAPPVADAGPEIRAAPGEEVVLDAGNSHDPDGRIASFRWDFGDREEPADGRAVRRSYAEPGIYSARLTVTDDSGAINGVAQDEVAIRINHQPVADAGRDLFTSASTVIFDGTASADADGDTLLHEWDFGDGSPPARGAVVSHTFARGGSYPVLLTVDDGSGLANARASTAVTLTIDRPPLADAGGNREACSGDVVVFDGSRSSDPEGGLLRYRWDFGDGTGADIVNPTKTWRQGAVYPVTLTVEDDSGFPGNSHTDRILVRVASSPIAEAGPDRQVCANTEVRFDGSASRDADGVVNRFTWSFGDGTAGGGERPVHIYQKPGEYRVQLTIEGDQIGQCANTSTSEALLTVVEAPAPRIVAPASVAVGETVTFDGTGSAATAGRITGWRWDFGDGATAEGPVAHHAYQKAGSHVVTLSLATEGGVAACSTAEARRAITVNAPPVAVADAPLEAAVGEELVFDGSRSRDPDGGITAWRWDFGDGATAFGVNARHRYGASGRYEVTLTVADDAGLANSEVQARHTVAVNAPPEPALDAPLAACPGEELRLSAARSRDADGTIARHAWSFGDGTGAEGPEVAHAYERPGLYALTLVVDDGSGLANARRQLVRPLRVNRTPRAEAGPDRMVCPGEEVRFDAGRSHDPDGALTGWRWIFGDGAEAEGAQVAHGFAEPGSYEVVLEVTDDSGSACAVGRDTVRVLVNAPPVAHAGGDREGFVGGAHDELLFDATQSADADGQPLSYVWELGDGVRLAGDRVRHSYAEPGLYDVRLVARDGSGLPCGEASDQVSVRLRGRE
ncbi:PKD domain-containing protein [Geminicoccaceae bacterium 1502E]|nr:PKD domain-containing protein [Geminicoccaceae bacterium 1502E]